ncbi:hypothetical protein Bbelb_360230 [Branchiostoma belcheri]|nr:hypothetical protein Bbelb_360230 [Branchiostoma belcheri]
MKPPSYLLFSAVQVSRETAHVLLVRQISRLMQAPEHSTRLLTQVDGASVHPGDPEVVIPAIQIQNASSSPPPSNHDGTTSVNLTPPGDLNVTSIGWGFFLLSEGTASAVDASFLGGSGGMLPSKILTKRRRDLIVRTPTGTPPVAGIPPGHISYVTDQMNRIKPMPARLLNPAGASRGYIPDGHRRNWDLSFNGRGRRSVACQDSNSGPLGSKPNALSLRQTTWISPGQDVRYPGRRRLCGRERHTVPGVPAAGSRHTGTESPGWRGGTDVRLSINVSPTKIN